MYGEKIFNTLVSAALPIYDEDKLVINIINKTHSVMAEAASRLLDITEMSSPIAVNAHSINA